MVAILHCLVNTKKHLRVLTAAATCSTAGRSHASGNHNYEAMETSKASFSSGLIDTDIP